MRDVSDVADLVGYLDRLAELDSCGVCSIWSRFRSALGNVLSSVSSSRWLAPLSEESLDFLDRGLVSSTAS